MKSKKFRKEKVRIGDAVREVEIPYDALWGPETALALENFPISSYKTPRPIIDAIVLIKKAAAMVHGDLNAIPQDIARAIVAAADETLEGKLDRHFVVDVLNSGAWTSLHMNVNEVLARRATQILRTQHAHERVSRQRACPERRRRIAGSPALTINPHNHVNFGQSTNDVIPTAIRIASCRCSGRLLEALTTLREALKVKAKEFWEIKTAGRTHTRDALPIRLGQRFLAYADRVDATANAVAMARFQLLKLGIGASAVGTGANTVPGYRRKMISALRELTGIHFEEHYNLFAATSGMGEFTALSGSLKALAIELETIAKDLELSSSGPNCGIGELDLPTVQPGSSIMPGKINPSIPENLSMVCHVIGGNAAVVEHAAGDTRWELNTRMPVIGWKLIESLELLTNAVTVFTEKCVAGIRANAGRCQFFYENTASWPTILNEAIGYDEVAKLVAEIRDEQRRTDETFLRILLRLAASRDIRTKNGVELTEAVLERLAFPKY